LPENGPILITNYNSDRSIYSQETFLPIGVKKLECIYDSNGNKTVIIKDMSFSENNTIEFSYDKNGNIYKAIILTTPGLAPGLKFNATTGQYEDEIPSSGLNRNKEEKSNSVKEKLFKKTGRGVYTNISEMFLEDVYEFEARIAVNESIINLTRGLIGGSRYGIKDLPVNKHMQVTLTGDDFDIESRSIGVQEIQSELIEGSIIGQWFWNIKPKKVGIHNLTLSAYIVTEEKGYVPIPAVRVPIKVIVSEQSLRDTISSFDWKWLISLIFLPVIGLICWLIKRRYPEI
jgi:hypothetical protein